MTTTTTPGAPTWIELFTSDAERAIDFYGALFGWTAEGSGPEYGGYITFRHEGRPVAGCMLNDGTSGGPDAWTVYLGSEEATATTELVRANGGEVHLEPMQVGPLGHMAFVADPGGAAVGIWQPLEHSGFTTEGEAGTPVWFELHTVDYPAAVSFYEKAFGWTTYTAADEPEFRYTTLGKDEAAEAGIMDDTVFGSTGPSYWTFYVQVDDTDAAIARVTELGGSVLMGPDDSPYGRLARVADPSGVSFMVTGPNQDEASA